MRWSILTPGLCIHWDRARLTETPGATKADAPDGDPVEHIWKRYYASIVKPAWAKIGAMTSEMPRKYWHHLPETALIPELIAAAQSRTQAMLATGRMPVTLLDGAASECDLAKPGGRDDGTRLSRSC